MQPQLWTTRAVAPTRRIASGRWARCQSRLAVAAPPRRRWRWQRRRASQGRSRRRRKRSFGPSFLIQELSATAVDNALRPRNLPVTEFKNGARGKAQARRRALISSVVFVTQFERYSLKKNRDSKRFFLEAQSSIIFSQFFKIRVSSLRFGIDATPPLIFSDRNPTSVRNPI